MGCEMVETVERGAWGRGVLARHGIHVNERPIVWAEEKTGMRNVVIHPSVIKNMAYELDGPFEEPPREVADYQRHMAVARRLVSEVRDVGRKHPSYKALMSAVAGSVILRGIWESALDEETPEAARAVADLEGYLSSLRS
jgi:hypothetical protein